MSGGKRFVITRLASLPPAPAALRLTGDGALEGAMVWQEDAMGETDGGRGRAR